MSACSDNDTAGVHATAAIGREQGATGGEQEELAAVCVHLEDALGLDEETELNRVRASPCVLGFMLVFVLAVVLNPGPISPLSLNLAMYVSL